MNISFKNANMPTNVKMKAPFVDANNFIENIAKDQKIYAGITAGVLASASSVLKRVDLIDTFSKNEQWINPEKKEGKEFVKLLEDKKIINNMSKTVLLPFFLVGAGVTLILSLINQDTNK